MPIFSDLSLYYCGSSTSFSPSFYTNQVSSFNPPTSNYTSRSSAFTGFSSGLSLVNPSPRLLPTTPRVNKYSPLLPTISETTSLSAIPRRPLPRISSPRAVPTYRAPRPIDIDTSDIDVTTPRKRTDRISRDRDDPQQGTIKRGRTVVRLHTKRLKDNPALLQNRRKTPGEKLMEKFLIKDKVAEEAKRRKLEEEANRLRDVYKEPVAVETESVPVENGENTRRRKSIQDCLQELEGLMDLDEAEKAFLENKDVSDKDQESETEVSESEALDRILSETESESSEIPKKPDPVPVPEPIPSVEDIHSKRVSVKQKKAAEKSNTVKKRPKKRDKNSTIKEAKTNTTEEIQPSLPPVEKSLLQRRNTVKKLRRNSRDIELLTLDLSGVENFVRDDTAPSSDCSKCSTPSSTVPSTPADSLPSTPANSKMLTPSSSALSTPATSSISTPVSSSSSTPATSSISTPVSSSPSTPAGSVPTTPVSLTSPSPIPAFLSKSEPKTLADAQKPFVPKTQSSNRDMFPFKTKANVGSPMQKLPKKISVDVSVENADDVPKKLPLKFVVDDIKVEETPKSPKSPKLFRYEVTVDEQPFHNESIAIRNDIPSTLENITEENETDVEFWNKEDAEAHKLSKLVKNISKFNEKEHEIKDCISNSDFIEKTFPATNKETHQEKNKKDVLTNKPKQQANLEQKFKFPCEKPALIKNAKLKSDKVPAIKELSQDKGILLLTGKKNESNLDKNNYSNVPQLSSKLQGKNKNEVITSVLTKETSKSSPISEAIPKSEELQSVDKDLFKENDKSSDVTITKGKINEDRNILKRQNKETISGVVKSKLLDNQKSEIEEERQKVKQEIKKAEVMSKIKSEGEIIPKIDVSQSSLTGNKLQQTTASDLADKTDINLSCSHDDDKQTLVAKKQENDKLEMSCNKSKDSKQTTSLNKTVIPDLFETQKKQNLEECSKTAKKATKIEISVSVSSKNATSKLTSEQESNNEQNVKGSTSANKINDVAIKAEAKDRPIDDNLNKEDKDLSKLNKEKISPISKLDVSNSNIQKDDHSGIPAWKKALIAKQQATKLQEANDLQYKKEEQKQIEKIEPITKENVTCLNDTSGRMKTSEMKTVEEKSKPLDVSTKVIEAKLTEVKTNEKPPIGELKSSQVKAVESVKPPIAAKKKPSDIKIPDNIIKSPETSPVEKTKPQTEGKLKSVPIETTKPGETKSVENKLKSSIGNKSDVKKSLEEKPKSVGKKKAADTNEVLAETAPTGVLKTSEHEKTKSAKSKVEPAEPKQKPEKPPNESKQKVEKPLVDPKQKAEKSPVESRQKVEKPPISTMQKVEKPPVDSKKKVEKSPVESKQNDEKPTVEPKQTIQKTPVEPKGKLDKPSVESKQNEKKPSVEPKQTIQKTPVEPKGKLDKPSVEPKQKTDKPPVESKQKSDKPLIETNQKGQKPSVEHNQKLEKSSLEPKQKGEKVSSVGKTGKQAVNKSGVVDSKPTLDKPSSVGKNTTPAQQIKSGKKSTPTKPEQLKSSGSTTADKSESAVAPTAEEKAESSTDATPAVSKPPEQTGKAEPLPATTEDDESSSEETESEEETETDSDDDGEEVTPASQRASTSSMEDSGFDSLPTSVPGSPACIKKGPDSKATSVSSGSSTDSTTSSPALSSNPGLDPYDDHSPPSTLARGGRVTPPATTIPRFRKYAVEDFQFLKVLGKGSFGKVLLAELKGTECYYAVKCLKKDVVLEDDDVECTLIERKVLALGTKHPYLCHLFCTFQTESHLFFVMEYLNGGDLMFHIQQSGRFQEPRAKFYGAEIVSGLKFLHKKGVVYRDLKLDNILLDFDGHVRIADFGMCKLQIYLDRTADTFCGTPDYMAPEIIKGLKYNQSVDWWSFGILLYEMLIGQSPFSGCDEDELFWSICNEQPHFPRFLSREANGILSLLLEKDASKRLGTNECMAGDVMDQPFFRNMDWYALEQRELEPPFKPRVQHPLDVQYFDKAFTAERAKLTPVEREILQSMDQTQFQGFSYTNPNATD
ncbi:uncharacterized protein Pkcdelta isoform X2 [Periplaneta americana]|uniref:uncharacterized protein Pkcdelta isoform X2 n=1 Tax=Periplaneta americana TaxID=6978 RepID=UPI0037E99FBB